MSDSLLERLRWSRGIVLAFSTQVRGFKSGRSRQIFKGEKILSTLSFGGEVKPSVPCHRFAAHKRSLNGVEVVISAKLPDTILAHSSYFSCWDLSRRGGRGGTWWWKVGTSKKRGKAMASYPYEIAQNAAYQSHTSRLTELWSLPRPAQGLNTNNNNNKIMSAGKFSHILYSVLVKGCYQLTYSTAWSTLQTRCILVRGTEKENSITWSCSVCDMTQCVNNYLCSSKIWVIFYQTTWHHTQNDRWWCWRWRQ